MNKITKKRIGLKRKENLNKKLALQVVFSIVLVAAVIVTKQFDNEFSANVISVTQEKITQSIEPNKVKENFQSFIGKAIEKIPFISKKSSEEFSAPVNGTIKSDYGLAKNDTGSYYNHGVDILSNTQTVKSISKGTVSTVGSNEKLSNYVVVEDEGKTIIYGKIKETLVKKGDKILKGDIIGALSEEDSMLHLEVWEEGESINPAKLFEMSN